MDHDEKLKRFRRGDGEMIGRTVMFPRMRDAVTDRPRVVPSQSDLPYTSITEMAFENSAVNKAKAMMGTTYKGGGFEGVSQLS